jgi:hypothetical protein
MGFFQGVFSASQEYSFAGRTRVLAETSALSHPEWFGRRPHRNHFGIALQFGTQLDILLDIERRENMSNPAQKRAVKNFRSRLQKKGLARFEVLGLDTDRTLIRSLATKLAQDDPEASRIRVEVMRTVSDIPKKGGILAALRRSPLVGAELKIERPFDKGRKVDL